MGLFDRKYCDVCGKKIGLLGNRKLDDGNLCKDCNNKLSRFFTDRRRSTLSNIKEQLAYREENEAAVAAFQPTRTLGITNKVMIDDQAKKFLVSFTKRWSEENPDVLDLSQITGCELKIDEEQVELKQKDEEGKEISYSPQRYKYEYDFWLTIYVNHPYFNEMRFKLNSSTVEVEPRMHQFMRRSQDIGQSSAEYRQYEALAEDIKAALLGSKEPSTIKTAVTCPNCGATSVPDALGRCEFCGSTISQG